MNVIINSAMQSPLTRAMASVPTDGTPLVHNVPDNLPPVDFTTVEVNPSNAQPGPVGGTFAWGQKLNFDLPQFGSILRLILRISIVLPNPTVLGGSAAGTWVGDPFFMGCHMVDHVDLTTRNREVQRLYGASVCAEMEANRDVRERWAGILRTSAGVPGDTVTADVFSSQHADTTIFVDEKNNPGHIDLYFPCLLNMLDRTSLSPNTRFLETMQAQVQLASSLTDFLGVTPSGALAGGDTLQTLLAAGAKGDSWANASMYVSYYNFHDLTSKFIRDKNFVQDTPATLLLTDSIMEAPTALPTTNIRTAQYLAAATANKIPFTHDIRSKNLVHSFDFFVGASSSMPNTQAAIGRPHLRRFTASGHQLYDFQFSGTGQRIYEGSQRRMDYSDPRSLRMSSQNSGEFQWEGTSSQNATAATRGSNFKSTPFNAMISPEIKYHRIQMGFNQSHEYMSGVVALQTLTAATMTGNILDVSVVDMSAIVANEGGDAGQTNDPVETANLSFFLICNFWQLVRIDSQTGVLSKNLNV